MADQNGANFSQQQWEQFKEHLERTYGRGTFFSKSWLQKQLVRKKHPRVTPRPTPLDSPVSAISTQHTTDTLEHIRADVGNCMRCPLCEKRTTIVFGEGNPNAELMFVGEGPGEHEDRQGRPFVGPAGQLLDRIIEAMGLKRSDVYITNVVKCRPPGDRDPLSREAEICEQFLFRQIQTVNPKVVVALGDMALKRLLLDENIAISSVRGKFQDFRGTKLMPTFHPAYLLRTPEAKKDVWDDMKKVKAELGLKT